jgi:hypothetical protein
MGMNQGGALEFTSNIGRKRSKLKWDITLLLDKMHFELTLRLNNEFVEVMHGYQLMVCTIADH